MNSKTKESRVSLMQEDTRSRNYVPPIIWLKELAKEMGRSERTIRRYVAEGRIKHVRIGKQLGFLPEHIREFYEDNTVHVSSQSRSSTRSVLEEMRKRMTKGGN